MTDESLQSESATQSKHGRLWSYVGSLNVWLAHSIAAAITVTLVGVLFATGAAASTDPYEMATYDMVLQADEEAGFMCDGDGEPTFLGGMLDTLLSFITLAAIPVFILLYQLDGLLELFALGADTKAKIKKHQRNMWIGAAKIFLAPPLLYFMAGAIGIDIPGCIDIAWWN